MFGLEWTVWGRKFVSKGFNRCHDAHVLYFKALIWEKQFVIKLLYHIDNLSLMYSILNWLYEEESS